MAVMAGEKRRQKQEPAQKEAKKQKATSTVSPDQAMDEARKQKAIASFLGCFAAGASARSTAASSANGEEDQQLGNEQEPEPAGNDGIATPSEMGDSVPLFGSQESGVAEAAAVVALDVAELEAAAAVEAVAPAVAAVEGCNIVW
jgi:hypothetical protein